MYIFSAKLGYLAPWAKKYFCAHVNKNDRLWSEK